ncbi:PTPA-CTERM sorting domain-containing protein [Pantanalinema sp. GBBB05]|uniref:PTPA-CTERM sorting domain-containing protein n=1 Tax=Pantanalinema sp. GBBB05 TaxID=2604139 RepID=UPI001DC308FE|nr:PTPA-CTERM sorting domain-containing protein [Pantanalinema sp. GBBB05]
MKNNILKSAALMGMLATGVFSVAPAYSASVSLGGYTFEPPPTPGSPNATGVATGLQFSQFTYVGTGSDNYPVGYQQGNPQNNGGKSFSADQFSPDSSINPNNSNADGYFSFSITKLPQLASFSLTGLEFVTQPNGNASPTNILIRSSLDGFTNNLFASALGSKNVWTPFSTPLSLNDLSGITFRIYPFGQNNNNGAKNLDIDNVFVKGSTTPVPTPALLPGLIAMGAGVWRKRKAEQAAEAEAEA